MSREDFIQPRIVRLAEKFYPAQAIRPHKMVFYEEPHWEETLFFSFFAGDTGPSDPVACFLASSWHFYARYNHRRSVDEFATILAENRYAPSTWEVLRREYQRTTEGRLPKLMDGTGEVDKVWAVHAESLYCEYFARSDRGFIHYVWQTTA